MKLKEIKQGMAIHCNSMDEYNRLDEEIKKLGFGSLPLRSCMSDRNVRYCLFLIQEYEVLWIQLSEKIEYIEFSDLVITEPELSAEEVLLAYDQMCRENYCCSDCPIYGIVGDECTHKMEGHISEIVNAIKQWKAEHEKKEPEIDTEWFWQGRIFKVEKDGSYYQIKDGNGFYDTGCEYQESAEEYMSDILKEYCKTHDGDFIAVVDRVCRVKAVE